MQLGELVGGAVGEIPRCQHLGTRPPDADVVTVSVRGTVVDIWHRGILGDIQEERDGGLLGDRNGAGDCAHPVALECLVIGADVLWAPHQGRTTRPVDAGTGADSDLRQGPPEIQGAAQRNR